jgi:hypothetical protein
VLNTDHLELQEQALEPLTRPKFKRLIDEYLKNRNTMKYLKIFKTREVTLGLIKDYS